MSKWELYELAKKDLINRRKSGMITPEEYENKIKEIARQYEI